METIPVIIINWNGIEDTVECIDSVLKTTEIPFHIYLIDNNSDNKEGFRLRDQYEGYEQISVKPYSQNYGFAKAHNRIWNEELSHTHCEFVALLNNDTVVDPGWLKNLLTTAHIKKADIVAAKMINYYDRRLMDNAGHRMLNTGEIIPIGHKEPVENHNRCIKTLGACAGAALYRSSMLKDLGFFDPYFNTGYEDAELGLRALVSGYSSYYAPDAKVYHKMGRSVKKIFNEAYSQMIHSAILYSYFKCMPMRNIILAAPSFIVKYVSMFFIDLVFFRISYLKILIRSWMSLMSNEGNWMGKRKEMKNKRVRYFSHPCIINFFWFDVKRFWNIIILNKASNVDSYGA